MAAACDKMRASSIAAVRAASRGKRFAEGLVNLDAFGERKFANLFRRRAREGADGMCAHGHSAINPNDE